MKILRTLTLLTFVLAAGLCSCSSDDKQKKEELLETQLLGTWNLPITGDDLINEIDFTFKEDLTCIVEVIVNKEVASKDVFSCKIDGNTVTMVVNVNAPSGPVVPNRILKVGSINTTTMIAKIFYEDGQPLVPGLNPDADCTFTKVSK